MNGSKQQDYTDNHKVSVIIPTYNRATFITKAMNSVWEQTYRPIEILVVDDGSTDATKEIVIDWISQHASDTFTVKYIQQENAGAPAARNNGIRNATGRYLQFLDSDDLLMPRKLELQIDLMKKEKTVLCNSALLLINDRGSIIEKRKIDDPINKLISNYKSITCHPPVLDRSLFSKKMLMWNDKLSRDQDKDFFMKVLMLLKKKSYSKKYLAKWVWHSGERIVNKDRGTKEHWGVFKSIFQFTRENWAIIPKERKLAVIILHLRLLYASTWLRTMVRFVRSGGKEFPT